MFSIVPSIEEQKPTVLSGGKLYLYVIQIEFTTTEHSGLLLLNGRYDGKHDFIEVEVLQGQIWCRLSLFSHKVIVTLNVNGGVIDGNCYKVEVALQNRVRIFFEKKFAI